MAARKKIGELQDYKERRRREREIYNLDQKILLDQIAESRSPRNPGPPIAAGHRDRLPLAKDRDVRRLQIEYERAREGGRNPHRRHRPSRRLAVATDTTPRYNPSTDPKVQMLAENHGRQMEFLQSKNRDLERQREEIRRRLEDLGRRPPEKDNSNEELLKELREQEARNQRLLDEMRRQLMEARRPINVIQTERQPEAKKPFIYPVFYGNSLVAEIIAVRQAYLQNGGNDPDILAQLAQMQAEAQAIDDAMKNDQRHPKNKKTTIDFSSLEVENERLQRQLQLLQEQKMISTNRRKDNREDELEREIQRMQRDHLRKMYDLQREMERLRQEQVVERMRLEMAQQQPTRIVVQGAAPPPPQVVHVRTPAPPRGNYVDLNLMDVAPYDQHYSPRPVQAYGHTWVHTQHRQNVTSDPYYDLQL